MTTFTASELMTVHAARLLRDGDVVFVGVGLPNIACNLVKAAADGLQVGPMLLGMRKPVHVLVPSVTARGIANLTALVVAQEAVAESQGG